jgi:hypothetical protein
MVVQEVLSNLDPERYFLSNVEIISCPNYGSSVAESCVNFLRTLSTFSMSNGFLRTCGDALPGEGDRRIVTSESGVSEARSPGQAAAQRLSKRSWSGKSSRGCRSEWTSAETILLKARLGFF